MEVDFDVVKSILKENLIHSLCRFIPEITKKKDGSPYPGKTLYEMIVSIQKYLNQNDVPWKIIEDQNLLMSRLCLTMS